jgi:hypothetical protein
MKYRNGFVSNSSSSSFIVIGNNFPNNVVNVTNFVKSFLFSLLHIVSYFGKITAGFCGSVFAKFEVFVFSSACEDNQKPPAKSNNKPNINTKNVEKYTINRTNKHKKVKKHGNIK